MGLENDLATAKVRAVAPANMGLMLALEDPNGVIYCQLRTANFDTQLNNIVLPATGRYSLVVLPQASAPAASIRCL